jgi:hypothetical protein
MNAHLESSSSAAARLKRLLDSHDPYDYQPSEIAGLQRQAIQDLFDSSRKQLKVLDRLASDKGIDRIEELDDLVPLLFSHQTYKSYPESFVRDNRWELMNKWLATLTTQTIGSIDLSDITDTDAWVARMAEHGHNVLLSSGTSGKSSFLNRSDADIEFNHLATVNIIRLMNDIGPEERLPIFLLGPRNGSHIFISIMHKFAALLGDPEATYWLSELELTEEDLKRQALLRARVGDGSATPGEIQELEERARERQQHMSTAMANIAENLERHKHEKLMIAGLWLPHFMFMEAAHARGIGDGELNPQSTIFVGGGLKGAKLPADYREQLLRFHSVDLNRYVQVYGMTELSSPFPLCSAGNYHCPPWIVLLVLNTEGTAILNPEQGTVEGRAAFFDTAVQARWGGVITSDKVEVNYSPCPCGRHSPSVKSISRYNDLPGGDDKLSCAGTVSSYVRGVIEE